MRIFKKSKGVYYWPTNAVATVRDGDDCTPEARSKATLPVKELKQTRFLFCRFFLQYT